MSAMARARKRGQAVPYPFRDPPEGASGAERPSRRLRTEIPVFDLEDLL
jgi:hypothetical protein